MKESILVFAVDVVAAYVSKNPMAAQDLPEFLESTYRTIEKLDEPEAVRPDPAVPISKSVTRQHIICLEDGAKLKMLKRYLRTQHNMTPSEYRARWGLPSDYPMVAPEYSERRSAFAKQIGLGKVKR